MSLLLPASLGLSGSPASASSGRIINGGAVAATDFAPNARWGSIVAVFVTEADGTRLCTGTLVASNWVATAAHCVARSDDASRALDPASIVVAANVGSTASASDHVVEAVSASVHPGFSWTDAAWDAALIELKSTVATTPMLLPNPATPTAYGAGTADNIVGFGRSRAGDPASGGVMRTGRVEQVSASSCTDYNPGTGDYADCYSPGARRQTTCFGDSGGALVRFDGAGRPVLWGITSSGPDPCDAGTNGTFAPSYATRATAVVGWMDRVRAASTYVPTGPSTGRSSLVTSGAPAASAPAPGSTVVVARSPLGGTGIGLFRSRVKRAPTVRKPGALTLSASFVGSAGTGFIEIERCVRGTCRTVARSTMRFPTAGSAAQAEVKVPRCVRKATLTLRLTVTDTNGLERDAATQRIARCA